MDPRDRFGSDAPIITKADAERALLLEQQRWIDGYFCVYDLIREHGVDQVLSWVRSSVCIQVGGDDGGQS